MRPRPIDENFSVSEQIAPEDVAALAAAGFRSIVCNRPDGEEWGQPDFAEVAAAAEAAGLEAVHLPVISGAIGPDDVTRFAALLQRLPCPVLGYCRSGARCTTLWNAAQSASTH